MEPQLELVELELAVARDDDLAVERRLRRQERADLLELGEVAQQRPPVARPEPQPPAQVLEHPAEAVPLRLVLPLAGRQLLDELGLHRREGEVSRRHRGSNAIGMAELDGVWNVERRGGLLPPLAGVRKRIDGSRGETTIGPPPGAP